MIKLLIVDDSKVVQDYLKYIFSADPEIQVIGVAGNGQEAVQLTQRLCPDVITMDLRMPVLDGLEATRQIMETKATPIVIVSGNPSVKEAAFSFQLIEAGALAIVLRPPGLGDPGAEAASRQLIQMVKCMAEVRVVTRINRLKRAGGSRPGQDKGMITRARDIRLIAIGASTGGPQALHQLLSELPAEVPVPILVVQHIALGFVGGFAQWLGDVTGLPVHLGIDGVTALPGHVYVAPDSCHLGIRGNLQMFLSPTPPEGNLRPAISFLFRSVAESIGGHAIGILLTGMGKDGSQGLKTMKDGGSITIAQDEASSIIFGMPGEAIKLDAATSILSPENIATYLTNLFKRAP
jgi:two-component system chemotaxis response regulator CheB